jgi:hypothetical protein
MASPSALADASAMPAGTSGPPPDLARLLASPLPQAGLSLRVQALPFRGSGTKADVQLIVEVLGGTLSFTERNGRFEEHVDLAMVTIDDRGRAGSGRSTAVELRLPADEFQRVRATGVRWLSKLELPPGRYQLRVAARARGAGRTGMLTHDVAVPAFDVNRIGMSAVTLTSLAAQLMSTRGKAWLEEKMRLPPSAARTFVSGDQIVAALEVYPPRAAKSGVTVTAHIERTGAPAAILEKSVPAGAAREEVAFVIDSAALSPGAYRLRLTASVAGDQQERTIPFEVVGR